MRCLLLPVMFGWAIWIVLMNTVAVNAHDPNHPELDDWYMSLKNKNGSSCCGNSDGRALSADDWKTDHGHYKVLVNDTWYDVPDYAVIEEPNKAGHAIVWPAPPLFSGQPNAPGSILCFMPGAMY